jgi:cytochrome c-type biogenesis protein CcmH
VRTKTALSIAGIVIALLQAGPLASVFAQASNIEVDARALEERLHAPCCRQQLLEGHDSEIARELRREIRRRLGQGESAAALEIDLVARYGESIVAVPLEGDPRAVLSLVLLAGLSVTAAALVALGSRWVRRASLSTTAPSTSAVARSDDALDARLEAELQSVPEATRP